MVLVEEKNDTFRWDRLTVSTALGFCLLVAALSIGIVLSELREEFGLSGLVAALHGSMFGAGLLVIGLFGVGVVARAGRRRALMVAASGMVSGLGLFCFGPNWPSTLLGAAIAGFGAALVVMIMPGMISDHHGQHRAAAFAAVNGIPGLAGLMFTLGVGAALGLGWSWRPAYFGLTLMIAIPLAVIAWPVVPPESEPPSGAVLAQFGRREVTMPWLAIVAGVLTEFPIGVWSATYLKEVGGGSSGLASAAAGAFGLMMFVSRLVLPRILRRAGSWTLSASFAGLGISALAFCLLPGFWPRVLALFMIGFTAGPLYPLTVDRLYVRAGHSVDSNTLGALCALASGVAIVTGPVIVGVLADAIDLRWAILIVPLFAAVGAVSQRPRVSIATP